MCLDGNYFFKFEQKDRHALGKNWVLWMIPCINRRYIWIYDMWFQLVCLSADTWDDLCPAAEATDVVIPLSSSDCGMVCRRPLCYVMLCCIEWDLSEACLEHCTSCVFNKEHSQALDAWLFPPSRFFFSTLIVFQESGPSPLFATRQACGPCSLTAGGVRF